MEANDLHRLYLDLTTPHVADAIMRLGLPVRQAPADVAPLWQGTHLVGRALPAQHAGSVDVVLEAFELSRPGDVLVVDNGGRDDEACVGDLVTLEAAQAALGGASSSGACTATPANCATSACPSSVGAHCLPAPSGWTRSPRTRSRAHGSATTA
jgi:hypothetical protein